MIKRASIAGLLHDLDRRSPAGLAIALHIKFARPTYLFQTYPKRWMDHYSANGLVMGDPTVHWGLNNAGYIQWGNLEAIDAKGVLEQAKDFGIMNGVTISVLNSGSRSISSFTRADRDYSVPEMEEMEKLVTHLHGATLDLERISETDRQALTEMSIRLTH